MNALATDQAIRINDLLSSPELAGHRRPVHRRVAGHDLRRVMTERSDIRLLPAGHPDHELQDAGPAAAARRRLPLWRDADIRYVVVDEFHSYDGAQGTDVAMLLRRLPRPRSTPSRGTRSARSARSPPRRRWVRAGTRKIREVAEQVFGTEFPEGSVITEQRLTAEEFLDPVDYWLPLPAPQELWNSAIRAWTMRRWPRSPRPLPARRLTDPAELGRVLRRHHSPMR